MNKKHTPASAPVGASRKSGRSDILRQLLRRSCMLYTGIALFTLLIQLIFGGDQQGIYALNYILFFPLAALWSLAGLVRTSDRLPTWAKVLLHPLLALGGFYLCFYLPARINWEPMPSMVLAIPVLTTVIYGITVAVILLVSRRGRQKKIDRTPYESQFKPKA